MWFLLPELWQARDVWGQEFNGVGTHDSAVIGVNLGGVLAPSASKPYVEPPPLMWCRNRDCSALVSTRAFKAAS